METLSENKAFGGVQGVYHHASDSCHCDMKFGLFLPEEARTGPVPVLWYLSGLTCTHENAMTKAGAQGWAAEQGIALVFPDTSPRGEGAADDPEYDLGQGAGFYVNATQAPWAPHYAMWDYVTDELPTLLAGHFNIDPERQSITGHSMGGHGALTMAMNLPGRYRSVSAFAPIAAPMRCPWGEKAFTAYLGPDRDAWRDHDTTELVRRWPSEAKLLVDQGTADPFLEEQLKPDLLAEACEAAGQHFELRLQPGYDHSYFFVASFMEDHIRWHAERLAG